MQSAVLSPFPRPRVLELVQRVEDAWNAREFENATCADSDGAMHRDSSEGRDAIRAFLASGDRAARERFFEHYYDRVYAYVARTVGDVHVAEDLTHEIFMKVDASLARIDPTRDPSNWVFTIAANAIRDHWRRQHTRMARVAIDIDSMVDPPADGTMRVDDSIIEAERHEQLHRAIAELSDDDQQLLLLRAFGELSNREVAHVLGIRADAVRKRWSRAVGRLGEILRTIDASEARAS